MMRKWRDRDKGRSRENEKKKTDKYSLCITLFNLRAREDRVEKCALTISNNRQTPTIQQNKPHGIATREYI